MSVPLDYTFHAMGSDVRLLIGAPLTPSGPGPEAAAENARSFVLDFAHRLSRFVPDSELCALNEDARVEVPASGLLRAAVSAGLWAAERSDGLVDSTLVGDLERAGYTSSLDGSRPPSLAQALAAAPAQRPAQANPRSRWREIVVDDTAEIVIRPPGVRFDTGGTGKGLCADALAHRLGRFTRFVVDCGGDIAVGGVGARLQPYQIEIEHPVSGQSIGTVRVGGGGVATSGLNARIWRTPEGGFAHHLLDPSTGAPVWSGLIGVTALGASALEAETLSKMALLLGPEGARRVLLDRGGVIVHDNGTVETVGNPELHLRDTVEAIA
jgi:thiamine biosynthesis lipoprotein